MRRNVEFFSIVEKEGWEYMCYLCDEDEPPYINGIDPHLREIHRIYTYGFGAYWTNRRVMRCAR